MHTMLALHLLDLRTHVEAQLRYLTAAQQTVDELKVRPTKVRRQDRYDRLANQLAAMGRMNAVIRDLLAEASAESTRLANEALTSH